MFRAQEPHMPTSTGLHHVTVMAGDPRRNLAFYRGVLGLRLIKKTVNFDEPGVYHLYYGDELGTPGTILTFFPFPDAAPGQHGHGETTRLSFAVPQGSLAAWQARLQQAGISIRHEQSFGESTLVLADPDGTPLALTESQAANALAGWTGDGVDAGMAIRGLHGVTLTLGRAEPTAAVLMQVLGYRETAREGELQRLASAAPAGAAGAYVDILAAPDAPRPRPGAGTVHHIAFRAQDDDAQATMARELRDHIGIAATPQQDRNYFRSIYFREPGGVLFEIATDAPGFAIDEAPAELGSALKLPARYEPFRAQIEAHLPPL
jgi:glyoxalase family protein